MAKKISYIQNSVLSWTNQVSSGCFFFCRYFFNKDGSFTNLTTAAYHKPSHLLVTAFSSGVFHLHELPHFHLVHSLR